MMPVRIDPNAPPPGSIYKGLKRREQRMEQAQEKLPKGGKTSRDFEAVRPLKRTAPTPVSDQYESPLEKYYADEESQLRKRGIDPMEVPQIEPPKLPTHPGNTTLHAKGGKVTSSATERYRKGGMVGCRDYAK